MAKKKVSVSSIFRAIYEADLSLLGLPTNDEIYKRYMDKTGQEVNDKAKQINANSKSILRKEHGVSKGSPAKPAPRKASAGPAVARPSPVKAESKVHASASSLEQLEENIDECLTFAKNLDRAALASVINHLRIARNEVVWKLSQK